MRHEDLANLPSEVVATRRDWRYGYLRASDNTRANAEILSEDIDSAMARVESCLTTIGSKGSAGAWLENNSLLAVRFVLESLRHLQAETSAMIKVVSFAQHRWGCQSQITRRNAQPIVHTCGDNIDEPCDCADRDEYRSPVGPCNCGLDAARGSVASHSGGVPAGDGQS